MTLIKRNEAMFPALWNDFFENEWFGTPDSALMRSSLPAVNIKETAIGYDIEMAAPGMKKSDFTLNLDQGVLTISSERKEENKEENKEEQYTRREFNYSSFRRVFTLPDSAESDKISATYKDGVLRISIPKKEEARPKPARLIKIA